MNNIEKRLQRIEEHLGILDDAPSLENSVIEFTVKPAVQDIRITRHNERGVIRPEDRPCGLLHAVVVGKPGRGKRPSTTGAELHRGIGETEKQFKNRIYSEYKRIYK